MSEAFDRFLFEYVTTVSPHIDRASAEVAFLAGAASRDEEIATLKRTYNQLFDVTVELQKQVYDSITARTSALEEAARVAESISFCVEIPELMEYSKQDMSKRTCREIAEAIRGMK